MPGITNINSSVLGGYGATRKTSISFKANSVEDLDILNRVYMHFGATVLLEFGHTVYISKDGEIKNMTLGDLVNVNDFYVAKPNLNKIRKLIADITEDKNYNYEGIVGYVTNFDFSFQQDGTYDCRIELISHNGVTDSLSIPSVVDNLKNVKPASKDDQAEADIPKGFNNIVEYICTSVEKYNVKQGKVNCRELFDDSNVNLSSLGDWVKNYDAYISTVPVEGGVTEGEAAANIQRVEGNFNCFFPLRFWLALFNVYAMPRVGRGKENQLVRWSMQSNNWRGFKVMYSHNPDMVQLSRKATGVTKGFNVKGGTAEIFSGKQNYRGQDLINVNEPNNRQILDIRVSTQLLKKVNDNFIGNNSKKNDEIGLTDFVELLLQEIQKYMGDINSFEIATSPRPIDEIFEELEIYDKSGAAQKGAPLNLTGLSTTVTSVGIKSNISNDLQVAAMFGGAGKRGEGGKSQAGIELHNSPEGLDGEDGIMGEAYSKGFEQSPGKDGAEQTESGQDIKDIIQETYDSWNAGEGNQFEKILDSSKEYVKSLIGGKALGKNMPIPVDLDIEMLGIGGFKNLETFTIPEHLVPPRFGNSNFIVMGVEHTLDAGESMWQTSITAILKP